MKKLLMLAVAVIFLASCQEDNAPVVPHSKWISRVVEYHPAPGQFINTSQGDMDAVVSIIGKRGMVSLGGYGGYIVFAFDHSVTNRNGADFVIHGNAFDGSSEAGIVMVSADENGNQKADDQWYELRGSAYDKDTKNYEVTYQHPSQMAKAEDVSWTDNKGGAAKITALEFHTQPYYPLWEAANAQLVFSGSRLADNAAQGKDGIWVLAPFEDGYADNYSADYETTVGDDLDTRMSNKFDLNNVVDKQGKLVKLDKIDFVKVYSALNQQSGAIGESSTEVCGAISLTN